MGKYVSPAKGHLMEELLRSYFLKAGYYVVRGVPYYYGALDVTDVDLWFYGRGSSVSREIGVVDAKNKKTPQAVERILWVQGLRKACNADRAIVATTEKRQEIAAFGKENGVTVLDGYFLNRLAQFDESSFRLSDEDFFEAISKYDLAKLDGDWKGRVLSCKSLLVRPLSFDRCNEWIAHAEFFANQSITNTIQRPTALRCLYLICSFLAVGVDFLHKDISFFEQDERIRQLEEGFACGDRKRAGIRHIVNTVVRLFEENVPEGKAMAGQVRAGIEKQLSDMNARILAEFFSKSETSRTLFNVAREFEALAMRREFQSHNNASTELKSMFYCLTDYWELSRKAFSDLQA